MKKLASLLLLGTLACDTGIPPAIPQPSSFSTSTTDEEQESCIETPVEEPLADEGEIPAVQWNCTQIHETSSLINALEVADDGKIVWSEAQYSGEEKEKETVFLYDGCTIAQLHEFQRPTEQKLQGIRMLLTNNYLAVSAVVGNNAERGIHSTLVYDLNMQQVLKRLSFGPALAAEQGQFTFRSENENVSPYPRFSVYDAEQDLLTDHCAIPQDGLYRLQDLLAKQQIAVDRQVVYYPVERTDENGQVISGIQRCNLTSESREQIMEGEPATQLTAQRKYLAYVLPTADSELYGLLRIIDWERNTLHQFTVGEQEQEYLAVLRHGYLLPNADIFESKLRFVDDGSGYLLMTCCEGLLLRNECTTGREVAIFGYNVETKQLERVSPFWNEAEVFDLASASEDFFVYASYHADEGKMKVHRCEKE